MTDSLVSNSLAMDGREGRNVLIVIGGTVVSRMSIAARVGSWPASSPVVSEASVFIGSIGGASLEAAPVAAGSEALPGMSHARSSAGHVRNRLHITTPASAEIRDRPGSWPLTSDVTGTTIDCIIRRPRFTVQQDLCLERLRHQPNPQQGAAIERSKQRPPWLGRHWTNGLGLGRAPSQRWL